MFGLWKKRKPLQIRPPTYVLIDGFQSSTDDFYQEIEAELVARKVPGLDVNLIDLREGNLLSSRRSYLRLRRERLSFDICSAPFGTSWFFAYRLCEIPAPLVRWEKIVLLGVMAGLVWAYIALFGVVWGSTIIGLTLVGLLLIMRNALTLGLDDFDAWFLAVPILGRLYEEWLRGDSFYRQDTREMWGEMMERVIQSKIRDTAAEKGVQHVQFIEAQPDAHPLLARLMRLPSPAAAQR